MKSITIDHYTFKRVKWTNGEAEIEITQHGDNNVITCVLTYQQYCIHILKFETKYALECQSLGDLMSVIDVNTEQVLALMQSADN